MHWFCSCFAFLNELFIRSPAGPNCAGPRRLLAAAATRKRKNKSLPGSVNPPLPDLRADHPGSSFSLPHLAGCCCLHLKGAQPFSDNYFGGLSRSTNRGKLVYTDRETKPAFDTHFSGLMRLTAFYRTSTVHPQDEQCSWFLAADL